MTKILASCPIFLPFKSFFKGIKLYWNRAFFANLICNFPSPKAATFSEVLIYRVYLQWCDWLLMLFLVTADPPYLFWHDIYRYYSTVNHSFLQCFKCVVMLVGVVQFLNCCTLFLIGCIWTGVQRQKPRQCGVINCEWYWLRSSNRCACDPWMFLLDTSLELYKHEITQCFRVAF